MRYLIKDLQKKIEKTYALETGITNIEQYIIGDIGYKRFYMGKEINTVINSQSSKARVLIREGGDTLKATIYYPDNLIQILEDNDPRAGIHDDNVDACASFVEELDHFLFIAQNFKWNKPFSMLELELQANITKYLVLKHFIALQTRSRKLSQFYKEYIKYHLFYKREYDIENASERARYEDTKIFATIYINYIDLLSNEERLREIRKFSRMSGAAKINHIKSIKR